jgi:hypothetical protein
MRAGLLVAISLLAVAALAVGWRMAQTRGSRQPGPLRAAQETSAPQAKLPRQSAEQRAIVHQQSPSQPASQGTGAPAGAAEEKETERRLGPFSISGSDYTVVLHNKKQQPGSTQETGDTVVAMEIQDAAGVVLYQRKFPCQETNDTFSDAWFVDARILAGTNGTGLLVSYSHDTEPSAPQQSYPDWWQVFGVVEGKLKPFGAPVYFEGQLGWEAAAKTNIYKSAGPLGPRADALQFRIWTGNFRMIFPVRVDWAEGKMTPAQPCDEQAAKGGSGENQACQYAVVPETDRQIGNTTFVTLCARPGEKCEYPVRVVVKTNSKVDLLVAQVKAQWNGGVAAGPSGKSEKFMDAMDDAGGVGWAQNDELWLKVRIDGKEGWMHGEEDFQAFGLPQDQ